ncbi:unnamed protein product, partial [Schistosoma intercalatum]
MFVIRLVSNLVVMFASRSLAQRGFVLRLQRFWFAFPTNAIFRFWIQTTLVCHANSSSKYTTSLLVLFSENDLRWQLDNQRSLYCSPILPSYNHSSADQSHDLNRYLSK